MQLEEIFQFAYQTNLWSDRETRSGPGSTLSYTRQLRRSLPLLLKGLGARSVLDAPCGDFNWMKGTDLGGCAYIGADIVPSLIDTLRQRYPDIDFRNIDITKEPIPAVDVWLCRDVLFHFSLADVNKVIYNLLRSNTRYFVTSQFFQCQVNEGEVSSPGAYYMRNLCLPPFGLPYPDYCLKDWVPGFPQRWLAVWKRSDLVDWFGRKPLGWPA